MNATSHAHAQSLTSKPDRAILAVGEELSKTVALRQQLEEMDLDEQTLLDTLEGATDLNECLLMLADEINERQAMLVGLKAYIDDLQSRKSRVEKTSETLRNIILHAMDRAGIKSIPGERVTLSTRATSPKLEVVDEAQIPSEFWKPQAPALDKKAVLDALKDGQDISGAQLGNGGISLTIRIK